MIQPNYSDIRRQVAVLTDRNDPLVQGISLTVVPGRNF